ncbi:hypothetical protein BKA93DRAFT_795511 [Sparassis latifolia]
MERKSLGRNDMQGQMLSEAVYDPLCPSIRAHRSWPFSGEFLVGTRLQGLAERQSVARARKSAKRVLTNLSLPESTVHDIWGQMRSEAFDAHVYLRPDPRHTRVGNPHGFRVTRTRHPSQVWVGRPWRWVNLASWRLASCTPDSRVNPGLNQRTPRRVYLRVSPGHNPG